MKSLVAALCFSMDCESKEGRILIHRKKGVLGIMGEYLFVLHSPFSRVYSSININKLGKGAQSKMKRFSSFQEEKLTCD